MEHHKGCSCKTNKNHKVGFLMIILEAFLFRKYTEIVFGFSTKFGGDRRGPFFFNMSNSVGDEREIVDENRRLFYEGLGIEKDNIALQRQVHGDGVLIVGEGGNFGESDALITDRKNVGLAISTADCTAIFLYDKKNKVIAGVHSGWRSTEKKILLKTLNKMQKEFNTAPDDLIAYIAPSIAQRNYEVGQDTAVFFDGKYIMPKGEKFLLNVSGINYDILLDYGVPENNIQYSSLCSYEQKQLFHSYRRDGLHSGRALGIIAMKG